MSPQPSHGMTSSTCGRHCKSRWHRKHAKSWPLRNIFVNSAGSCDVLNFVTGNHTSTWMGGMTKRILRGVLSCFVLPQCCRPLSYPGKNRESEEASLVRTGPVRHCATDPFVFPPENPLLLSVQFLHGNVYSNNQVPPALELLLFCSCSFQAFLVISKLRFASALSAMRVSKSSCGPGSTPCRKRCGL